MLNPPTKWQRFWAWVDDDFNNTRPWSLGLFCILAITPLGLAFAFNASADIVETTRLTSIAGVILVFAYYLYRQLMNLARWLRGGRK